MKPTATYLLIETKLRRPLDQYVRKLRADERSWPYISRQLEQRTGIKVSDESLRLWFADTEQAA